MLDSPLSYGKTDQKVQLYMPGDSNECLIDRQKASKNMILDEGNMRINEDSDYGQSDNNNESEMNLRETNPYSR